MFGSARRRSAPLMLMIALAAATLAAAPARPTTAAATTRKTSPIDSLAAAESRVRWATAPAESAIVAAARAQRPAFLDFYADWCAPCRWMDRAVYPDPLLGEVSEGVVMVRIDIETPEGRRLANRYGVFQYPTLVYLAPDGREILRWPGPLSLRDTRLNLAQVGLPASGRAAMEAERAKRPHDVPTQARALLWYGWRGEVERVRAVVDTLERTLAGTPDENAGNAMLLLGLGKAEEMAGRPERALAAYRRALEREPEGAFAWRAWLGASACLEAAGDRAAAEKAAREAPSRNQTPWLAARVARLELAARAPALPTPPGIDPR
jgi:thioredoxin-like negative regulator of GroEL